MTEERLKNAQDAVRRKKPPPLPEELYQPIIQWVGEIDDLQFKVGYYFLDVWDEIKSLYTEWYKHNYDLSDYWAERKAHKWLVENTAERVKKAPSTIRHWYNVCKDVTPEMREEHEIITYSQWDAMRGGQHEDSKKNLEENLEWFYEEMEYLGNPPGCRDIENHIKGNGGDKTVAKNRRETLLAILKEISGDDDEEEWMRELAVRFLKKISERLGEGEK